MEENLRQKDTKILRITTYGPESTGKTTLARDLANHFDTVWIPEFARDFLKDILDTEGRICEERDLLPIAIGQTKIENDALEHSNKYLFCDTNALVTKVYSDIYYNHCGAEIEEAAKEHHYDLYFLTDKDVPWEDDGLRDSQEYRDSSFEIFKQNLIDYNKPFIQISGNKKERLEKASKIVLDLEKALNLGLTSHEFVEIYNQKKNFDLIFRQIHTLRNGLENFKIDERATIGNGIFKFTTSDFEKYVNVFELKSKNLNVEKFVPASGAASRMFKFLSDFLADFDMENESVNAYVNRSKNFALETFIFTLDKFPFFKEVNDFLATSINEFDQLSKDQKNYLFIKTILSDTNFNYLNKPKAVIPFHKYPSTIVTPIVEHFKESETYTNKRSIHFTISSEHLSLFEEEIAKISGEKNWSFSYQDPSTDSIAIDENGNLLKNSANEIIFRPGGHGSLIYNLNNRSSDVIFIKNIDNVGYNNISNISFFKKALGGLMLELQNKVFDYLNQIDSDDVDSNLISEIKAFINKKLQIKFNPEFENNTQEEKIKVLKSFLNRPIRVCGMVKNENEPGGGPFWIKDKQGNSSLQIVESAQINLEEENQKKIFAKSTHFNPVDLVCGIVDYKGQKFNLLEFTNPETGFIVEKSKNGINYKAYELPGLWNGSMANWITVFVEVPLSTFSPVKTVNDLLKPSHQPH